MDVYRHLAIPSMARRALCLLLLCTVCLIAAVREGAFDVPGLQRVLASVPAEVETRTLVGWAGVYAVALALPFVPGMELGLLLMVAFGPRGVLVVYVASLVGLSLSYAAGRFLPLRPFLPEPPRCDPRATHASETTSGLPTRTLVIPLTRSLPIRPMAWLSSHRYLALAVCLNLPGNALIGGGGGIAWLCGVSGQYGYRRFIATVAIALSPLPILLLLGFLGLGLNQLTVPLFGGTLGCWNLTK
jgi:hypothetical protein